MQINESLNMVIPLRENVRAYHTPISREVFEANFRALSATKASLLSKGKNYMLDVGPQISALLFKDEAKRDAADRGEVDSGAAALLMDIKRLTRVLAPGASGWEEIPIDVAIGRNIIDADDWREAESGLVFFTCLYSIAPRSARKQTIEGIAARLGGLATPLSPMEYIDFLRTSMQTGTTDQAAV